MGDIGGQSSGDYLLTQGALRILYSVIKDTIPVLADDGFTQSNPNVVTTPAAAISTTLPANVKNGVLGGSVAFVRPDIGGNTVGGAVLVGGNYVEFTRPLGLFLNDALGNANENTPAVASGKNPHTRGGAVGNQIYETAVQTTVGAGVIGTALVYSTGNLLYASVNGYLTNRWQDAYEVQWITAAATGSGVAGAAIEPDITRMGVILSGPDATSLEMFVELNIA
jgi:hypothetical protein